MGVALLAAVPRRFSVNPPALVDEVDLHVRLRDLLPRAGRTLAEGGSFSEALLGVLPARPTCWVLPVLALEAAFCRDALLADLAVTEACFLLLATLAFDDVRLRILVEVRRNAGWSGMPRVVATVEVVASGVPTGVVRL